MWKQEKERSGCNPFTSFDKNRCEFHGGMSLNPIPCPHLNP